MTTYALLAPRHLLRRYLRQGWRLVGPAHMHHGVWSFLMTRDKAP